MQSALMDAGEPLPSGSPSAESSAEQPLLPHTPEGDHVPQETASSNDYRDHPGAQSSPTHAQGGEPGDGENMRPMPTTSSPAGQVYASSHASVRSDASPPGPEEAYHPSLNVPGSETGSDLYPAAEVKGESATGSGSTWGPPHTSVYLPYSSSGLRYQEHRGYGASQRQHMQRDIDAVRNGQVGLLVPTDGADAGLSGSPLLSQRISFYQQAWQYYGGHLGHKELQSWAMLGVLLVGMLWLGGVSNGGFGDWPSGERRQIAAVCCVLGVLLVAAFFAMTKLQLVNRDTAVQCANASVVALQQTMHEMRRSGGGATGAGDVTARDLWKDSAPDSDRMHESETGRASRPEASSGEPDTTCRGRPPVHDAVWAGFVGKLHRAMNGGAGRYPVALHAMFNVIGGLVSVSGLFIASLPVGLGGTSSGMPSLNLALSVLTVLLVWAAVG